MLNETDFNSAESAIEAAVTTKAQIVIITSNDNTYKEFAVYLANEIKKSKPNLQLLLAGWPGENETTWRDAGIDNFVHIKVNTLETLNALLSTTGAIS